MDKMKFETPDMAQMNVEKIAALFPNCVTESKAADGKLKKAVNFDALKQMLGESVAEGDESYEFTWVCTIRICRVIRGARMALT